MGAAKRVGFEYVSGLKCGDVVWRVMRNTMEGDNGEDINYCEVFPFTVTRSGIGGYLGFCDMESYQYKTIDESLNCLELWDEKPRYEQIETPGHFVLCDGIRNKGA